MGQLYTYNDVYQRSTVYYEGHDILIILQVRWTAVSQVLLDVSLLSCLH